MSHTYISNFVHCVFATKQRQNLIPGELQAKLWAYLIGIARNLNITLIAVGGTPKPCLHLDCSALGYGISSGRAKVES